MKKNTATERSKYAVKASKVKSGDLMAFVYYAKVKNSSSSVLNVQNLDDKMDFSVQGKELIERSFSADQFEKTIKVNKTRAAEILVSSYNRPFTVCFDKQGGGERVLRGRLVHPEPLLGRSMVEDLDITSKNRLRQVDHRTIKYIIVEGAKYQVTQYNVK